MLMSMRSLSQMTIFTNFSFVFFINFDMNASNPPDISKIRQILEDPEAFNLSIDYQQMREVLNELFQQTDSNNKYIENPRVYLNYANRTTNKKDFQDYRYFLNTNRYNSDYNRNNFNKNNGVPNF